MGGGTKKVLNTVGRGVSAGLTLGASEVARNNLGARNPISQALQGPGAVFTGGGSAPDNIPSVFGYHGDQNPGISGPFSLDPNQVAADENAIKTLGGQQYNETIKAIGDNAGEQEKYAADLIQRRLPGVYEDLNARHLLQSSALPQEIARELNQSSQDLASKVSTQKMGALQGAQGYGTSALQRRLGLEDFVNQANVAKTIGAQMAPQPPSGKQNFGTVASGVGALSPWAKVGKAAAA